MSWAIVGTSSIQELDESAAVPRPVGLADGDLWIVWVVSDNNGTPPTLNIPAGWTAFGATVGSTQASGHSKFGRGFYKVVAGEPATVSFTSGSANDDLGAASVAMRGFDPADIVEAYGTPVDTGATPSTSFTGPTVVPATDGCLILAVFFAAFQEATFTFGGGFASQVSNDAAESGHLRIGTLEQATAASIAPTATVGTSSSYLGWTVAINPAPSGGGGGGAARSQIISMVG